MMTLAIRGLAAFGIHLGKEGVYFDELTPAPRLQVRQGMLTLQTGPNLRNTGKAIYRVEVVPEADAFVVRAYQRRAVGKGAMSGFRHQQGLGRTPSGEDARTVPFYWVDPDGRRHLLVVEGWKGGTGTDGELTPG